MTNKQKRFCEEYVIDSNGTQAAIRAGYSPDTAYSIGSENLKKPEIISEVEKLQAEISERNKITVDELVQTLAKLVRFDIADLYDESGNLKNIHEIDRDARLSLEGVETDTRISFGKEGEDIGRTDTKKVKLSNRKQAIDMLLKHLGGYREDNAQRQPTVTLLSIDPLSHEPETDNGASEDIGA